MVIASAIVAVNLHTGPKHEWTADGCETVEVGGEGATWAVADWHGTLDQITNKLGPRAVGIGPGGHTTAPGWTMKREILSRRATTRWDELCEAAA